MFNCKLFARLPDRAVCLMLFTACAIGVSILALAPGGEAATITGTVTVSGSPTAGIYVTLDQPLAVPTLQEIGLLVLVLALIVVAIQFLRRRRALSSLGALVGLILIVVAAVSGPFQATPVVGGRSIAIDSTTTNGSGVYSFTNVAVGSFVVYAIPPDSSYGTTGPMSVIVSALGDNISVPTINIARPTECPAFSEPTGVQDSRPATALELQAVKGSSGWRQFSQGSKIGSVQLREAEAVHVDYAGSEISAVVALIENAGAMPNENRFIISYFDAHGDPFQQAFISITPRSGASGTTPDAETVPLERIALLTPEGAVVIEALFSASGELELREGTEPMAGYWKCVGSCLKAMWKGLPWWYKVACAGSCAACWWVPNLCYTCVGCLGSPIISCLCKCA
ncbi:MAG: hypothetical protein HZB43_01450 [candidate division Zixibacteria bacterium]|nr:hypothetical protein [candidate division Zixibacteria bacterium]